MQVRVLVFGVLRDRLVGADRMVDLPSGATVSDILAWARASTDDEVLVATLAVAVNREYAGLTTQLHEGDEVALLPPVSGGLGGRCELVPLHV